MKNLFLFIIFLHFNSFGQYKETSSIIEKRDFNDFNLYGDSVKRISKVEYNKIAPDYLVRKIFWIDSSVENLKDIIFRDYDAGVLNNDYRDNFYWLPGDKREEISPNFFNIRDWQLNSNKNYKYFTKYSFYKTDIDESITISYGERLLRSEILDENFNSSNNLFYKKTVEVKKNQNNQNQSIIKNQYNIAVKIDNSWHKYWQLQGSAYKREFTLSDNEVIDKLPPYVWIFVDDKLENGFNSSNTIDRNKFIYSNVYEDKHRIILNEDFEFVQKISFRDFLSPNYIDSDHCIKFVFGLENPNQEITKNNVENAIEYKLTYISEKSTKTISSTYKGYTTQIPLPSDSYVFEVIKKINGILYEEKKVFSSKLIGEDEYNKQKTELYPERGKYGQLKIFRKNNEIYFVVNGNLIDVTKNHIFKNHTLRFNSYYDQFLNNRFRPINNVLHEQKYQFEISKTIEESIPVNIMSSNEWKGNGSGFFISKSGYIVTNHHVINDANEIEIEYKFNEKNYIYKAEVVQMDPSNDLAILKINDKSFKDLSYIPYNLKTKISDTGTSVFALGFPMALSGMGKEIKFTDGKISSKTGYEGDIRTYQTSTPIQGGNSGGPLFDYSGNLIGINSSKISSDKADNVSYSIKSSYLNNLIEVLPVNIPIPNNTSLVGKNIKEQIKILSNYVVLIKVK